MEVIGIAYSEQSNNIGTIYPEARHKICTILNRGGVVKFNQFYCHLSFSFYVHGFVIGIMQWIAIGTNFWNLRGSFTFGAGLIEIGTHCSLIKLSTGKFLLIDTIKFSDQSIRELNELTANGRDLEAVIATHPFHTVFFPACFKLYPDAKYYGTPRHLRKVQGVNWQPQSMSDPEMLRHWESEEIFMRIPDGAEFENPDENNHFSSVHVFHKPSRTIHVDDTIMYFENPGFVLRMLCKSHGTMEFWTLKDGLRHTEAAPTEFKAWVQRMIDDWDFDNICTAHTGNKIGGAKLQLLQTLQKSDKQFAQLCTKYKGKK